MASASIRWVVFTTLVFFFVRDCSGQLVTGFYNATCPNLTSIISSRLNILLAADVGLAAGLLRLHFHDCWVRGCDGSVLLNSTNGNVAEKDSTPNANSLIGFAEIDTIKSDVEAACPGVVSCADILALAAEDATSKVGNVSWPVPTGRRDGTVSIASEAVTNLPPPSFNFAQLVQNFATFGLDTKDMVVLSGAHTIGRTRCLHVTQRLWNFTGVFNTTDPSINATFVDFLKGVCPSNAGTRQFVSLDSTGQTFDSIFYNNILALKGVLGSDSELINNAQGLQIINTMLANISFAADFGVSMVKLGNVQVKTGTVGEIRKNCAVINS
ncbi:peroxidase [Marchantia polymorpha subsp. ruderalis]